MSDQASPVPKRRRRWLRWVLLIFLLLLVAIYFGAQPLAFYIARRQIAKLGGEQKLDIQYDLGGSIWSRLRVRTINIVPTGPNAVSQFKVGEIDVGYDLWRLIRGGVNGDFLGDIVLRDAEIEIDPSKAVEKAAEKAASKPFEVPKFPLPRSLVVENVNVRIKGGIQLAGLTLRLQPGRDDVLQVERLEVPGLRPLGPLKAVTKYGNREVLLRDLRITPSLAVEELVITPRGTASAKVTVNGGRIEARLEPTGTDRPAGQPHSDTPDALGLFVKGESIALRWPDDLLTGPPPARLGGRLEALKADFTLLRKDGKAATTGLVSVRLADVQANEFGARAIVVSAEGESQGRDPLQLGTWAGKALVELTQPRADAYAVDAVKTTATLAEGGKLTVSETLITRGSNRIVASGNATLIGPPQAEAKFDLNLPDLGQLALEGQAAPLLGSLKGAGQVAYRDHKPTGEVTLEGAGLQARGGTVEQFTTKLRAVDGLLWLDRVEVRFDASNRLALGGYARFEGVRDFKLEVNGELPRLELFEPALQANGVKQRIAGSVQVKWLLTGEAADAARLRSSLGGGGDLTVRDLKIDANAPISADLTATLAGERFALTQLTVRAAELELAATARLADGMAALESIKLQRKGEPLLAGYARVPFDLNAGRLTEEEKFDIDLATARPLPLAELWSAAGRTGQPPASGTLALSLKARGGLKTLVLDLGVQGRNLQIAALEKLRAAEVDLAVGLKANKATLDGTIRQPQLQPVVIKGAMPLDLAQVMETKTVPQSTPIEGSVRLPPSDLRALLGVVPGLRFIEGQAGADVTVSGTLGAPRLRGQTNLNVPAARFENLSIPALRGLKFRIGFTDHEATIEQGDAEVAGGKLSIRGKASFPSVAQATLDFAINGKDLLVARDESILVRTNADVKIAGPLASATVSGRVALTKSRFLKDIEIVPLPLPGDKKAPPSAPPPPKPRGTGTDIGIKVPPLRDWKFDLAIKTDDPFRISGNLARGRLVVDLKVTGTGAEPQIEGPVTIEQLSAKLPFSRFDVERGSLYFTPDQPLNPLVDLSGASQIRDRRVNVSVYGRANDPKTAFSSEPPLPQEQILTLLATGATLDELRDNSGALAGKALVLGAQRIYHKIFPSKSRGPEDDSFLDRFDLDVGNADPKTGAQTVAARYRVSDRVVIMSDFDEEGHFRGRVKYLIRFK